MKLFQSRKNQHSNLFIFLASLLFILIQVPFTHANAANQANYYQTNQIENFDNTLFKSMNQNNPSNESLSIGEECRSGERLPSWSICLYGEISLFTDNNSVIPQSDANVIVSLNGKSVSGKTFIYPHNDTPTFGIDISPLSPAFLEAVTLTVELNGVSKSMDVVVLPNFETMSQRYDVYFHEVGALSNNGIWGHIFDYGRGEAIEGVQVAVEHQGESIIVQTSDVIDPQPTYNVSYNELALINAFQGDTVKLVVSQDGETIEKEITLLHDLVQVDFVTGWKCNGFDPLPKTGGINGLPKTGGINGLPDISCFWGYVRSEGEPKEGATVQLAINGNLYEGITRYFPGEQLPRFGIPVRNASDLDGLNYELTAIESGFKNSVDGYIQLDSELNQRIDVNLDRAVVLSNLTNGDYVNAIILDNSTLWSGTENGLYRWNLENDEFVYYTNLDGLPSNFISDLLLDSNGTVWIGTSNGITRFNPENNSFDLFKSGNNNSTNDYILSMEIDNLNRIWIGTGDGLMRFDPIQNEWASFTKEENSPLDSDIRAISISDNGIVWVGTGGNGLGKLDPTNNEWTHYSTSNSNIPDDHIRDIEIDSTGDIWIGSSEGLIQFDLNQWVLHESPTNNDIYSITIDSNDDIWVGARKGGLNIYSPLNAYWDTQISSIDLTDDDVNDVVLVGDDIWIATWGGGVNKIEKSNLAIHAFRTSGIGLIHNDIKAIAKITESEYWIGTWGGGISRLDVLTGSWSYFDTSDSELKSNFIWDIVYDDSINSLWIGTRGGGLALYNLDLEQWTQYDSGNSGLNQNNVQTILLDPQGGVWLGTGGGLNYFDLQNQVWKTFTSVETELVGNDIQSLAFDQNNDLWIGTNAGLSRLHIESGSWNTFIYEPDAGTLLSNEIRSLLVDQTNNLWIGSKGGLNQYDIALDTWISYTSQTTELENNDIHNLAIDTKGHIWIGTWGHGISKYQPKEDIWITISTATHGLVDNRINDMEFDNQDQVWLGTSGGVSTLKLASSLSDLNLNIQGPEFGLPNSDFTFEILIENLGEIDANDSNIAITLPEYVSVKSSSHPVQSQNPLIFDVGNIPNNSEIESISVTAHISANATPGVTQSIDVSSSTMSNEVVRFNNIGQLHVQVVDPFIADVQLSMVGPDSLLPGSTAVFKLWVENIGGLQADGVNIALEMPADLSLNNPDALNINSLPSFSGPVQTFLFIDVSDSFELEHDIEIKGTISTKSFETVVENNSSSIRFSEFSNTPESLILIASDPMVVRHGASQTFDKLYELSQHQKVNGIVVDILTNSEVLNAYSQWENDFYSVGRANAVAESVKTLIDNYLETYPSIQYLTIVGSDEIIPFYRVKDQNSLGLWDEESYSAFVPRSTVQAALSENYLLTDDYYVDLRPTVIDSPFWLDEHPLLIPDLPVGRLVESPEDILSTIHNFIQSNGEITLNNSLINYDPTLTVDLGTLQCDTLTQFGFSTVCFDEDEELDELLIDSANNLILTSPHSNHFSMGELTSFDIAQHDSSFDQSLLISIGCHAGLNVPDNSGKDYDLDIVQAFLNRGGVAIGSTAYTYASVWGIGYSEALASELTDQLLLESGQPLGNVVVQAKHQYYVERSAWLDFLDEKILLPITLYGLPMIQVNTGIPSNNISSEALAFENLTVQSQQTSDGGHTVVPLNFDRLPFQGRTVEEGSYFHLENNVTAQERLPIQPLLEMPIESSFNFQTVHGIVLRSATYRTITEFEPIINQSWALNSNPTMTDIDDHAPIYQGWDRELPYSFGQFFQDANQHTEGPLTHLTLIPGVFNNETQSERLFIKFQFEILYSDIEDFEAPIIQSFSMTTGAPNAPKNIQVSASDNDSISSVIVVCDNGKKNWRTFDIQFNGSSWNGICPQDTERSYVQVVDLAGNVSISDWQ